MNAKRIRQDAPLKLANRTQLAPFENLDFSGFPINASFESIHGPLVFRNCSFRNAWRATPDKVRDGQGIYLALLAQGAHFENCFFDRNGWQPGRPLKELNELRHGVYLDFCPHTAGQPIPPAVTFDRCIFARNCSAGTQTRHDAIFDECIWADNAINILHVFGAATAFHPTIIGGHWTAALKTDATGQYQVDAWTANTAAYSYADLAIDYLTTATTPTQLQLPPGAAPTNRVFPSGALSATRNWPGAASHPAWAPCPSPQLISIHSAAIPPNWPRTDVIGQQLIRIDKNALCSSQPYDPNPILDAIAAQQITIDDAVTQLGNAVRALTTPTPPAK